MPPGRGGARRVADAPLLRIRWRAFRARPVRPHREPTVRARDSGEPSAPNRYSRCFFPKFRARRLSRNMVNECLTRARSRALAPSREEHRLLFRARLHRRARGRFRSRRIETRTHRDVERVSLEPEKDVRMFERVARTCGAGVACLVLKLSSSFLRHAPTSRLWNLGRPSLASIRADGRWRRPRRSRSQPADSAAKPDKNGAPAEPASDHSMRSTCVVPESE